MNWLDLIKQNSNIAPEHKESLLELFSSPMREAPPIDHSNLDNMEQWPNPFFELPQMVAPYKEIWSEYQNVQQYLVPHQNRIEHLKSNESNYAKGWKSACIHGVDVHMTEGPLAYGLPADTPMHWTSVAKDCPVTVEFIKSLPFQNLKRVRFMLLEPWGYTLPHTDYPHMHLKPLNIAIKNPDSSCFKMEGFPELPLRDGRGFVVNIGLKHTVLNLSSEPRLHIIVHGTWDKKRLKKLFERG